MKTGSGWKKKLLLLGLFLTLAIGTPDPVNADYEKFRANMRTFAKEVSEYLKNQKANEIHLRVVDPIQNTSPGPGVFLILGKELANFGIRVTPKAIYEFHGTFKRVNEEKVKLIAEVKKDNVTKVYTETIFKNEDVPGNPIKDPPMLVKETAVYSEEADGKFGIEVLVQKMPRAPILRKGMPFLRLEDNEVYEIRLINDSTYEAAVSLQIDGINIFEFNEDREPDGKLRGDYRMLVPPSEPGKLAVVNGWYRKDGKADGFKVTDYSKSKAAELIPTSTSAIGIITATFKAAWKKGDKPPPGEGAGGVGTTSGPTVDQRWKREERIVGRDRATVVLRYDRN